MNDPPRLIDCDVRCAPLTQALQQYLRDVWHEHVALNARSMSPVAATYPDWNPSVRTPAAELTLDRVRAEVLDQATLAVLHCYHATESFTHPYFGSAVATPRDPWMEGERLEPDERPLGPLATAPLYPQSPRSAR